jgi:hypothetical protein
MRVPFHVDLYGSVSRPTTGSQACRRGIDFEGLLGVIHDRAVSNKNPAMTAIPSEADICLRLDRDALANRGFAQ